MPESSAQTVLWPLLAGASVACLAYAAVVVLAAARDEAKRFRLEGREATSPWFKLLRPVGRALGYFFGRLSARVEMAVGRGAEHSFMLPARIWSEKRLRSAAHPEGVSADEFIGLIVFGGIVGLLVGLICNIRLQVKPVILLFVAAGMYMPLLWLRGRVHHRQYEIRHDLPYTLDLLTISVEAGLDFTEAIARIVRKLGHSPLAVELGETLRMIRLGRSRTEALRDLGRRVDLGELNSLVSALIQADQLGSSLGPILRVQADQLRMRRSQQAEKAAMEAPVKILLPLVVLIFPTVLIMIGGPILMRFVAK